MTRGVVRARDGIRIHYRRLGRGPGLVLLHGYPQTGHMWRKVMPVLAERFTVVAPDLRGYGDSDRPASGYDKRTMAADVADVISSSGAARGGRPRPRTCSASGARGAAGPSRGTRCPSAATSSPRSSPKAVIEAILAFAGGKDA